MDSDNEYSDDCDYSEYNEEELYGEDFAAPTTHYAPPNERDIDPEHADYECLSTSDVETSVNKWVADVSDSLHIQPSQAKLLLLLNAWNAEQIKSDYKASPDEYLARNGLKVLQEKHKGVKRAGNGELRATRRRERVAERCCGVCFETEPNNEFRALECGHEYCAECWRQYIQGEIEESKTRIVCMEPKCRLYCSEDFIREMLSPTLIARYEQSLYREIIITNPRLSFCPGADCPVVVESDSKKAHRVTCNKCKSQFWHCKTCYCSFLCNGEYHAPTTCDTVRKWLVKCADDSETANYISANTKDCPRCHASIEKNGGCNHMHCSKCGEHFCWVCCGDWKSHGSQYYNCSRYQESSEINKADARKALERYLHYFTRYENHQKSLKMERDLLARIKKRIESKVHNHEGTWIDWQYLYDASFLLTRCRYTLQYTYPFAYYMSDESDKARKELFEYQQAQLEKEIEELSWKVERAEATDRGELEAQMHSAERKRRTLLHDFFE